MPLWGSHAGGVAGSQPHCLSCSHRAEQHGRYQAVNSPELHPISSRDCQERHWDLELQHLAPEAAPAWAAPCPLPTSHGIAFHQFHMSLHNLALAPEPWGCLGGIRPGTKSRQNASYLPLYLYTETCKPSNCEEHDCTVFVIYELYAIVKFKLTFQILIHPLIEHISCLKWPRRSTNSEHFLKLTSKLSVPLCDGGQALAAAPCSPGATEHLHLLKTLFQTSSAVTQQLRLHCSSEYSHTVPLLPPAAAGAPAAASPPLLPLQEENLQAEKPQRTGVGESSGTKN